VLHDGAGDRIADRVVKRGNWALPMGEDWTIPCLLQVDGDYHEMMFLPPRVLLDGDTAA
jgi:hypothetical protein